MKNAGIIALVAVSISLALLSGCCCNIPTGIPGWEGTGVLGGGEAKPEPIQAIKTVGDAKLVLKTSLANKEITDFEVFASPEEVIVEYFDDKTNLYESEEKNQLAYVLASTAVAYYYPERITAHRYVEETPKKKASAKTEDILEMVAGNTTFSEFVSEKMDFSELSETEAIMPRLEKETLQATEANFGE